MSLYHENHPSASIGDEPQASYLEFKTSPFLAFALIYFGVSLLAPSAQSLSATLIAGTAITALAYGVVLNFLMRSLPLKAGGRFLLAWLAIYVIQMLNPLLEGLFFTNLFEGQSAQAVGALIFGLALTAPTAIAAALLFTPPADNNRVSLWQAILDGRKPWTIGQLAGRLMLAAAFWTAVYFVFGLMAGPLVLPYYTVESVGFDLRLPPLGTLIALQFARGLIYALALLPLVLVSKMNRLHLAWTLAGLMYVGGALAIFLFSDRFPIFLRAVHGVELALDSLLGGFVFAYVLRKKAK